jgi:hypothetical protein
MAIAHLVGRINLRDTEEVFRTVAELSGATVARIPDGERGARAGWIAAQLPALDAEPALERGRPTRRGYSESPTWRLRPGASPADIDLDLPYRTAAQESYDVFARLKADGVIAPAQRMLVTIPSPIATVASFLERDDQTVVIKRIQDLLAHQVHGICRSIPRDQLAIQWDIAVEFFLLEMETDRSQFSREDIVAQLVELASLVAPDVEVGFHLCYGDSPPNAGAKGRHFTEPTDAGLMVAVANATLDASPRAIDFIHMPVPIERDDEAYFRPLADLRRHNLGQLFLGLVHDEDGLDGAQRRARAALASVSDFGVATECGMGNEPAEAIPRLLAIQRQLEL